MTKTRATENSDFVCIAPGILVPYTLMSVPIDRIDGFSQLSAKTDGQLDYQPITFSYLPILIAIGNDFYELLQSAELWRPELKRIKCSHILSIVISGIENEIENQIIRELAYNFIGCRAVHSRAHLLRELFTNTILRTGLRKCYTQSSSTLTTSLCKELYGHVIGSKATIDRHKDKHGKTNKRKSPSQYVKHWDDFADLNNYINYKELTSRLVIKGDKYKNRFDKRLKEDADLNELANNLSKVVSLVK